MIKEVSKKIKLRLKKANCILVVWKGLGDRSVVFNIILMTEKM